MYVNLRERHVTLGPAPEAELPVSCEFPETQMYTDSLAVRRLMYLVNLMSSMMQCAESTQVIWLLES